MLISNQSLKVIIDTLISCLYLNAALTDVTLELVVCILLQWILSQRKWHFKCFPNTLLLKTIQDFDFTSEGQASYHHASFQWQTVLAMLHDFLYIDYDHIHFTFYIKANVFNNSIKRKVASVIPTLIKREKWYTLKLSILSKVTSLIDGEVMTLSRQICRQHYNVCVSVSFLIRRIVPRMSYRLSIHCSRDNQICSLEWGFFRQGITGPL